MITVLSPIMNFVNKTSESIKIGDDLVIREATTPEISTLKGIYQRDPMLGNFEEDYGDNVQVIESLPDDESLKQYVSFEKFTGSERDFHKWSERNSPVLSRGRQIIQNKLAFLRLMKAGQIACNVFMLKEPIKEGEHLSSLIVRYYTPWRYRNYPYLYELSGDDIDDFRSEYSLIGSKICIENYLGLRYFCKGYHEPLLEDRMVDTVIGLESLYLPNEPDKTALTYKLAMRCAAYIEEQYSRREEVRKNVLTAHKLRSKIVHGAERRGKDKKEKEKARNEMEQIFPTIEMYLRTSLVNVFKESRWPEGEDFDRLLLQ